MFEASGLPGPHPPAAWVGTRGCTPDARGAPLECVDCDHSTAWRARNPWWAGGASQRALVQRAVENAFTVMVAPSAPYTDGALLCRASRWPAGTMPPAVASFASPRGATQSCGPMPWRTTFGGMTRTAGDTRWPRRACSRRCLGSARRSGWWRWGSTSRHRCMARSSWSIATRAVAPARAACGRRPTRSRRAMTASHMRCLAPETPRLALRYTRSGKETPCRTRCNH